MEQELLNEIRKEINLLDRWIIETVSGGWSTHLVDAMKKRKMELMDVYFKNS